MPGNNGPCRMKGLAQGAALMLVMLAVTGGVLSVVQYQLWQLTQPRQAALEQFGTCSDIVSAFSESRSKGYYGWGVLEETAVPMAATQDSAGSANSGSGESRSSEYSETNVQVEGVDEADIVKTDGEYLYVISGSWLVVIRARPAGDAEVVSETDLGEFTPQEMYVDGDNIMLFGYSTQLTEPQEKEGDTSVEIYPYYRTMATVQLWDVSDRSGPERIREVEFEGSYLTSRKIGTDVYFVINSYPEVYVMEDPDVLEDPEGIIPVYRDSAEGEDFVPSCGCGEVSMLVPSEAESFITLASMSITDPDAGVEKEVIVGSGQNVYASMDSIYIAEYNYNWGIVFDAAGGTEAAATETTVVHKFGLEGGGIEYLANAEVPGRVLNQFSMDEHDGYFRIATTVGRLSQTESTSMNNVYVYDSGMELAGKLEDLAPGESIYSARFMGDRAYLVTFKKIDPLFVIDLSDPEDPAVLGKLKIPGYSDYLHPYDEDHIIGIGKETVEAEEEGRDFAWYQGVKIALFDVSDVENPVELHKVVIGDRGTDSYALDDHKAFLFDREKGLLVIPILLAEIQGDPEDLEDWEYGDYVYQGAYVYGLDIEDGFDLRGRITHYDDDDAFEKSGYYFRGDYSVMRSGYIDDVLWTLSQNRLKLNGLADLEEIGVLDFGETDDDGYVVREGVAVGTAVDVKAI